ncbi:C4-dicarboxylate ABC transporter substrate-binding protein [Amylibacter ulvae]|uniref:C4-dicarboxylate ABC transporter substrate-binding protein n=1 Tax=Paramylibacter ulvae TaxID=1651968 RepID=A0ABQ3D6C4_9RHOB|nr:TAXI family TRAP transporter solute-binding subunit [Amylibacter ulvae]GHA58377.1 C4-dicarboxylate ABC transporter substrate-binding protein [Amylibacter ulvae]
MLRNFLSALFLITATCASANDNDIGMITGNATGTYVKIGADLSAVLDETDNLRIIPMLGRGSQSNIHDILNLDYVDMGLVQSDVLTQIRLTDPNAPALDKISYIAKIYNEELHVLARRDSNIHSIYDLSGKNVSTGGTGSGSESTSRLVLKFLDISVSEHHLRHTDALESLKSGDIDAMMFVAGKPTAFLNGVTVGDNLRLIPLPFSALLASTYQPSIFESDDYPALIENGFVQTISVGAILAVFDDLDENTPRYHALAAFCDALLKNQDAFKNPARHTKWQEFSPRATVPGWRRFLPMARLLAQSETVQ